jgi:hypothetical protein
MEKDKPGKITWLIHINLVIYHLDENKMVDNFNVLGSAELSALLTIKILCKLPAVACRLSSKLAVAILLSGSLTPLFFPASKLASPIFVPLGESSLISK